MKVLMISGDKHLLEPGSAAYKRLELQKSQVEVLDVFVWPHTSAWKIFRAARKNRYNVITVQDPFWRGLVALKIAWLTRTKLNVQVHADLEGQSFVKHVLAQIVLRHADSVRVVSEKLKNQVARITKTSVRVLPVYIDVEDFRTVVPQPHETKTILWVGRFEPEKDPAYAIPILQRVRKEVDAKLVMLGTGSLESILMQDAKNLPIEFPGWQEPLPFLQTADVVVSTSKHESYGASIIEALAAGVPVVARDVGIAKEAGAIVTTREKLAEAVIDVLQKGTRGALKLSLPSAEDWAQEWKESLV